MRPKPTKTYPPNPTPNPLLPAVCAGLSARPLEVCHRKLQWTKYCMLRIQQSASLLTAAELNKWEEKKCSFKGISHIMYPHNRHLLCSNCPFCNTICAHNIIKAILWFKIPKNLQFKVLNEETTQCATHSTLYDARCIAQAGVTF